MRLVRRRRRFRGTVRDVAIHAALFTTTTAIVVGAIWCIEHGYHP